MKQPSKKYRQLWILFFVAVLAFIDATGRGKTDIIVMRNGDTLTGEIKAMDRGRLNLSTDYMGTVAIEWKEIDKINSRYTFEVEQRDGSRYFGSLDSPEPQKVQVAGITSASDMTRSSVVRLRPVEDTLWDRFSGYLDFGLSYTKAHRDTKLNLGSGVTYETRKRVFDLTYSSLLTQQESVERSTRNSLTMGMTHTMKDRWFNTALVAFDQNQELDLKLRSTFGGGMGRRAYQSNRTRLSLYAGSVYTRERYSDEEELNNIEGMAGVSLDFFQFDTPKADISASVILFPSFTSLGRFRVNTDVRLRYEVFKDFFFGVTLWENFDSQPPTIIEAQRNDYGFSTTFGWSY
jgi:hypothetical protein